MKTILLSYVLTNALSTLFITLLWHQYRKRYAGLGLWLIGFVLHVVGILLLLLREEVPELLSIIIANTLIIIGVLCLFIGLELFVGKQSPQTHNYLLIVGFAGAMTYFTFIYPSIPIRTILISIATILLMGQCSLLMLQRVEPTTRTITRGVGWISLLYVLGGLARILDTLEIPLSNTGVIFQLPTSQMVFFMLSQVLIVALTLTLILMTTRRLTHDIQLQELKYTSLFNSMKDGVAICQIVYDQHNQPVDYRILDVNPAYEQLLGVNREQVISQRASELHRSGGPSYLEAYTQATRTQQATTFETYFSPLDKFFNFSVIPISPGQFAVFFDDITEHKRTQQKLEWLASFPRLNPNPVIEVDMQGEVIFQNDAATNLALRSGKDVRALLPKDWAEIMQSFTSQETITASREVTIDGTIWEESMFFVPQFDTVHIYMTDITSRKRSEELIKVRMRLMEFAVDHTLDELLQKTIDEVGAIIQSPIGFYHFVEEDQKTLSLQAWSSRTIEEFCTARGKGMHYSVDEAGVWVDCVHQRRAVIHNDYASLPHRKGMPEGHAMVVRELVVPIMRGDRIVAILGIGNKPTDYTEEDVQIVTYLADVAWEIAERKRSEEALQALTERYRAILAAVPDIIMEVDNNKVYTWANQAGLEFFGADVIGKEAAFYFEGEQGTYQTVQPLFSGVEDVIYVESPQRRHDGEVRILAWWCRVLKDSQGNVTGALSTARDITDYKRAEAALKEYSERLEQMVEERTQQLREAHEQLIRQERLVLLGEIASGIGHELRNPLATIKNAVYLLNLSLSSLSPEIQETLDILEHQVDISDNIITSLLNFARSKPPNFQEIDVREALDAALAEIPFPENITVSREYDEWLPTLTADASQLQIVFSNLIRNAIEAMPEGGNLTLAAHCAGDQAMLSFSDSGAGIAPEAIDKIFQPMFTKKTHGLGLGLALCKLLIERHGGEIRVASQVGQGTTFTIYLPLSKKNKMNETLWRGKNYGGLTYVKVDNPTR